MDTNIFIFSKWLVNHVKLLIITVSHVHSRCFLGALGNRRNPPKVRSWCVNTQQRVKMWFNSSITVDDIYYNKILVNLNV